MRGKEAARTAARRAAENDTRARNLQNELAQERARHRQELNDLRDEIRRLRSEHVAEASKLAAEEVQRRLAEVEKERRSRGLSDDVVIHLAYRKDRLIRNACRYISMTDGVPPADALAQVLTWCTEKDVQHIRGGVDFLIELGVPLDGWVAGGFKHSKYWEKAKWIRSTAISLDNAEEQNHPKIHPRYDPKWYPRGEYGEGWITVVGDGEDA